MYKVRKKLLKDGEIKTLDKMESDAWIELVNPDTKELQELKKKFSIPSDFLHAGLDEDERPRIEVENGIKLFIIRVPLARQEEGGMRYRTMPLAVIFTKSNIITVCLVENPILNFFLSPKARAFSTAKRTRFFFQTLDVTNCFFAKYVDKIEAEIKSIESEIRKSMENEAIMRFLSLQKSLVYFNNAIMANKRVIEKIMKGKTLQIFDEDEDLMDDVIIENEQVLTTVQVLSDVLNSTMDAYASIISNNLNIVMKFLASVTIMLTVPTIISSFYGMNLALPAQRDASAFANLGLLSALICGVLAVVFWKKKWL